MGIINLTFKGKQVSVQIPPQIDLTHNEPESEQISISS